MDPLDLFDTILKTNYESITPLVRRRYTPILVARACRFYIENYLDVDVVEEDLYREGISLPNLKYSEELEKKYYKEAKNTYKKIYGNRNPKG